MSNKRQTIKSIVLGLLGFTIFLIVWETTVVVTKSPSLISSTVILKKTLELWTQPFYHAHIMQSFKTTIIGSLSASALGILMAVGIYNSSYLRGMTSPLLSITRGLSPLTLFPLLIILFGIGQFSRILVIVWTAFPSVMLSTLKGLQVEKSIIEASRDCGANEFEIMIYIRLPLAIPSIVSGMRISFSAGWMAIIAAEMLGSNSGLGFYLMHSAQSFKFPSVYGTMLTIGIIGGLSSGLLTLVQNKFSEGEETK